jgi:long-chain fatty acid transport protein
MYVRLGFLCALAWASLASPCLASPLMSLIGDTTSGSGGLQARSVAGGSAAAYFNPSLLSDAPASVTLGFSLLNERIGVSLDGRPGPEFGIADGLSNAAYPDGKRFESYPIATNLLQFGRMKEGVREAFAARPRQGAGSGHGTKTYEVVGIVMKFLDDRLGLGLHAMIPNGQFMRLRAFFNDEREQYFSNSLHPELYGDRMTALSLATGIGFKLTPALSLGVGATFAIAATVSAPAYVLDTGDLSKVLIDLDGGVNTNIAPHFGAHYKLGRRLRLSATLHAPQQLEFETRFQFLLPTGLEQASGLKFVLHYMPWQAAAGASWDVITEPTHSLTVAGTLTYAGWSAYPDRHATQPSEAYAWSNTLSPTLGARFRVQDVSTYLDVSYVPTPTPLQTGRTNYVDNDRIASSLGGEYGFRFLDTSFRFGVNLQVHRLVPRHQLKLPTPPSADGTVTNPELVRDELPDNAQLGGQPVASAAGLQTNNPGWPGFASGGWVLGATLYLAMTL